MFWKYTSPLDPDTASPNIHLSENGKTATFLHVPQYSEPHPGSVNYWGMVFCKEPLRGYKTWTVEYKGYDMYIGVSYKSAERNHVGLDGLSFYDFNDKAWGLHFQNDNYSARHNESCDFFPAPFPMKKIKVTVNRWKRTLSFYAVYSPFSSTKLYTFYPTFTEDPYPVFEFIGPQSSVTLV